MILKDWLIEHKIKMTDLAKILNYSKGNLSRIVNFKLKPSYQLAIKIQKITNNEVMPIDLINKGE